MMIHNEGHTLKRRFASLCFFVSTVWHLAYTIGVHTQHSKSKSVCLITNTLTGDEITTGLQTPHPYTGMPFLLLFPDFRILDCSSRIIKFTFPSFK